MCSGEEFVPPHSSGASPAIVHYKNLGLKAVPPVESKTSQPHVFLQFISHRFFLEQVVEVIIFQ